jgi:hypothetical protein
MLLDKFNLESGHVEDDRRIVLKYILRKLDYEDEKWMAQIDVRDGASCVEYMLFISRGRLISRNSVVSCPRRLSVIINSNFLYTRIQCQEIRQVLNIEILQEKLMN